MNGNGFEGEEKLKKEWLERLFRFVFIDSFRNEDAIKASFS